MERGEQSAREAQSTRQSDKRINSAKTPEDPCLLTWYDLRPAPHTTQAGTRVGGRFGRSGRRDDMDAVRRATAEHNNTSREFAVAGLEGEGREWKSHSIQTVILGRLPQSFIRYDTMASIGTYNFLLRSYDCISMITGNASHIRNIQTY